MPTSRPSLPCSPASHQAEVRVEADGVADGGWGPRLEGDITVVAGKSGGKWEIQRPGDKWLITAGEREPLAPPAGITRATTRDGVNTPRSLGRNAKLYGRETWDGDVRGWRTTV